MQTVRTFVVVFSVSLGVAAATLLSGAASAPRHSEPAARAAMPVISHPGQTLTQLADGRWLFIGGEGPDGPLATATLWDPRTNAVTLVAQPLGSARAWHSATVLPDGTVFVFGGIGAQGEVLAAAELFHPDTQSFVAVPIAGLTRRAHHTATLLTEGQVLLAGGLSGQGETLSTADLWDFRTPAGGQPTLAALTAARRDQTAVLLAEGTVLLWGGTGVDGQPLTVGDRYDPVQLAFTPFVVPDFGPRTSGAGLPFPHSPLRTPHSPIPQVVASVPVDGGSDIPLHSLIALRFSTPAAVQTVTASTVMLSSEGGQHPATVTAAEGGMIAFVLPQTALRAATTYTVTVDGVMDEQGRVLPRTELRFTTTAQGGTTAIARSVEGKGSRPETDDEPDTDTDDDWTPDASNLHGDWRSKRPEAPAQFLPPRQADPGVTALAGQVLKLNGKPLKNVTVQIGEVSTQTDHNGQFLLAPLLPGPAELLIDGRTANTTNKTFGLFEIGVELAPGVTTVLPYTIWMPRIDTAHAVTIPSPTTNEVIVTTPRIPGLELHLPAGTVLKDHEGKPVTQLSITPIPVDQPPHPLPVNVDVPVYFTIQPGGAYIVGATQTNGKGAWIVYPNYVGEAAGARFDFWRYDPEELGWTVYGEGTVNAAGSQIVPDPNVRIYEFTGAMINGNDSPPVNGPPPCDSCCGGPGGPAGGVGEGGSGGGGADGDPCDLNTGFFFLRQTDLALPDTLPLALTRVYRTQDANSRPFGIGTTHPYAMFLWSANQYQQADLILPDGGRVHYVRTSSGTGYIDAVFASTATPTKFYHSRLAWNGKGWDLTLKDGTVYLFGENAPLQAIRDRFGNTVSIAHANNQAGNITQITSPNGRWIKFTYDASNRITQAQDNSGRTVSYTYDASGRLWKVTDPNGGIEEYTYDTSHRLLTRKDKRGNIILTNQYDANGRIFKQTLADTGLYQFAYTLNAGKVTQTDVTDPRGKVRRVTLNSDGYRLTDTRALGLPEQQVTTYVRQVGTNLPTSMTDALGRQTTYTYDTQGNVTSVTRLAGTADAVTTSLTYEPNFNQIASLTDPLNHTTTFAYDSQGNLTTLTDATNRQVTFTYNTQGQPLTVTTPAGTTSLSYVFGDLATVSDPLGNVTTRLTDSLGRLLSLTNTVGQKTQYTYDSLSRLTQVTDPLNLLTAFAYDPNSNLLSLTDARNGVTQYTYDTKDRVATRKDPLLRQESFVYDGKNNLTQSTDRKAQVTTLSYDGLNRPTVVTYQGGETVTSTYDAGNRVTQVVDSVNGMLTRSYDGLDRLTSETTPQGTVTYTYDAAGRRTSLTVAGQATVNYTYDNANRLTQVSQGSDTATLAYDAAGRRGTLTLLNGVVITYGYDVASRLTSLTYTQGATTLGTLTYSYDQAGRRLATSGSFARTGVPPALNTANYDAANQQLVLGTQSATFDNNGNLATLTDTGGTTTYTWNARDQLVSLSGPSVTASFQYDAFGRRKQKTVNGTSTNFLYDGLNVVQELNGTTPIANLLTSLGIDETLLRTDAAGARSFLTDGLGSTLALTDTAGLVQSEYTYEPFGKTTATGAASTNTSKYTGREDDGTGLYYYRARYYHPGLQRFISEDPIGFNGGDPNLYAYVRNDPVNFYDPAGENAAAATVGAIAEGAAQGAGGIIGGIAGGIGFTIGDWIFPSSAGDAADMLPPGCYLSSRPRGFWPLDSGGEEWGRRNGVGKDEGRRRAHREKQRDKGRPRDPYSVNPDTGEVANPQGEVVGNLNQ